MLYICNILKQNRFQFKLSEVSVDSSEQRTNTQKIEVQATFSPRSLRNVQKTISLETTKDIPKRKSNRRSREVV